MVKFSPGDRVKIIKVNPQSNKEQRRTWLEKTGTVRTITPPPGDGHFGPLTAVEFDHETTHITLWTTEWLAHEKLVIQEDPW